MCFELRSLSVDLGRITLPLQCGVMDVNIFFGNLDLFSIYLQNVRNQFKVFLNLPSKLLFVSSKSAVNTLKVSAGLRSRLSKALR